VQKLAAKRLQGMKLVAIIFSFYPITLTNGLMQNTWQIKTQ